MLQRGVNTTQAQIVKNLPVDYAEINHRIANGSNVNLPLKFGGGGDPKNHKIVRGDIVMCTNRNAASENGLAKTSEFAWSAWNGTSYSEYASYAELAEYVHFGGISRTTVDPTDPKAPENGIAAACVGSATTHWTENIGGYAADWVQWNVPDPGALSRLPGQPKDKIHTSLSPFDFRTMKSYIVEVAALALTETNKGTLGMPYSAYKQPNLSKRQSASIMLRQSSAAAAMDLVMRFSDMGMIRIVTPSDRDAQTRALKLLAAGDGAGKNLTAEEVTLIRNYVLGATNGKRADNGDAMVVQPVRDIALGPHRRLPPIRTDAETIKAVDLSREMSLIWLAQLLQLAPLITGDNEPDNNTRGLTQDQKVAVFAAVEAQQHDAVTILTRGELASETLFPNLAEVNKGYQTAIGTLKRNLDNAHVMGDVVQEDFRFSVQKRVIGILAENVSPHENPTSAPNCEIILGANVMR